MQEIADLSELEFIQGYRQSLTNQAFSRKLVEQEWTTVFYLLKRIERFIHVDDYVRPKRDMDNEVNEIQTPKRFKHSDHRPKYTVYN